MMVSAIAHITDIIRAIEMRFKGVRGGVLHRIVENRYQLGAEHIHFATKNLHITITKFVNNFPNFYQKSPIFNRKCNRKTLDIPVFFAFPTLSILPIFSPKSIQNPCHTRLFTIHTY